jgi:hypothetical protein
MAFDEMRVAPARDHRAAEGPTPRMVQTPRKFLQGRRVHFSSISNHRTQDRNLPGLLYSSGGVNVGSLDGSVRFVKDSVSQLTWWALHTKGGGEIVSSDSY